MSGDPVEESGQQLRQGAIQAFQMAHTTAALMRGRGSESRSAAEHTQRLTHADQREARSAAEHQVRVEATVFETNSKVAVNTARISEIEGRMKINTQAHQLAEEETRARMDRADTDLERRDLLAFQQFDHSEDVQDEKLGAYEAREERAEELHRLEVEYKQLLIDARRRAAGFVDSLSEHGPAGAAGESAAAFAAAEAERVSSEAAADAAVSAAAKAAADAKTAADARAAAARAAMARAAADAYAQRFAEDVGRAFDEVFGDLASPPVTAGGADARDVLDVEFFDIVDDVTESVSETATVEAAEPEYPTARNLVDAVRDLAGELTVDTDLAHTLGEAGLDLAQDLSPAAAVADAVEAALDGDAEPSASVQAGARAEVDGAEVLTAPLGSGADWGPQP
ncbi:hypothetical protein [Nocardia takedensis]|uniref:hypothetical protein n=1 Tax=Nocardia takedensis TaxID=259390 RepID=UPI000314BF8D|nr:hypothetical protein [Nocardia takedensis]